MGEKPCWPTRDGDWPPLTDSDWWGEQRQESPFPVAATMRRRAALRAAVEDWLLDNRGRIEEGGDGDIDALVDSLLNG